MADFEQTFGITHLPMEGEEFRSLFKAEQTYPVCNGPITGEPGERLEADKDGPIVSNFGAYRNGKTHSHDLTRLILSVL